MMNAFDMIIIVVLGFCIIRGVFRGFVREITSIAGLLAGFYTAYTYYRQAAPLFAGWISDPAYAEIAGFLFLFCGVFLVIMLIGILIGLILKIALLGVLDRIFGAVFGALKGALMMYLLFLLLVRFLPPKGVSVVQASRLAPFVNAVSKDIVRVVPQDIRDGFKENLDAALKKEKPQAP